MDKPIRIAIVEDHEATLKGLTAELSAEPDLTIVGTAGRSDEGLKLVQELKPDVVLLDLHLPDSQGPKSLAETFCKVADSRIIVFSGDSRMAILQIVLQTDVWGYLLKSEPISKVAQAIRDVIAGKRPIISSELVNNGQARLTGAEQHLLKMLARGMKYQEIANQRVTSPETVRKQVEVLLAKLSLNSREELIAWAVDSGYGKLELEA
ncbi:MAG TPA: response regulator transcription factor [Trichormus sp.]|jgi:DNA-binding NarL/FixJ family response regulator